MVKLFDIPFINVALFVYLIAASIWQRDWHHLPIALWVFVATVNGVLAQLFERDADEWKAIAVAGAEQVKVLRAEVAALNARLSAETRAKDEFGI